MTLMLIMQVGLIAFHFLVLLWAILGIYIKLCLARSAKWYDAFMLVMYCCFITCIGRCIAILDPMGFYEIYGPTVELFLIGIVNGMRNTALFLSITIVFDAVDTHIAKAHSFKGVKYFGLSMAIVHFSSIVIILSISIVLEKVGAGTLILSIILSSEGVIISVCCWLLIPKLGSMKHHLGSISKVSMVNFTDYSISIFLRCWQLR